MNHVFIDNHCHSSSVICPRLENVYKVLFSNEGGKTKYLEKNEHIMSIRTIISEISHSTSLRSMKKSEAIVAVFEVLRGHIVDGMTIRDVISILTSSLALVFDPLVYTNEYIETFVSKCIRRGLLVQVTKKEKGSRIHGGVAVKSMYRMVAPTR